MSSSERPTPGAMSSSDGPTPGTASDAEQLSRVEDGLAIERLVNRYALLNDTFRVEELVGLFTEDAVFDMVPAGLERYEGRDAIREFFDREKRALTHLMHLTSNHLIELDGDSATGTAYFLAMGITRRAGVENHARGYYQDSYRRTSSGWRFASRSSNPLLPFQPIRAPSADSAPGTDQAPRPGRVADTNRAPGAERQGA